MFFLIKNEILNNLQYEWGSSLSLKLVNLFLFIQYLMVSEENHYEEMWAYFTQHFQSVHKILNETCFTTSAKLTKKDVISIGFSGVLLSYDDLNAADN